MTKPRVMREWVGCTGLLLAGLLSGCAHVAETLISVDGAPTDDVRQVARIIEDPDHPALLRGVDEVLLDTLRVPHALSRYAYVLKPGQHRLWVAGLPYPHPLIPQRHHCYALTVELAPGMRYRLREDERARRALLVREDTGETVSTGERVDEPWVFQRGCRWR